MLRATHRDLMKSLRGERGAEQVEFAFVAPVALFLFFALIYLLSILAAQISLSHATSVGARYAAIPTDVVAGTYPSEEQVAERVYSSTPFFSAGRCTTTVDGEERENAQVSLRVSCDFPIPGAGGANRLFGWVPGQVDLTDQPLPTSFAMHTEAESRRE